MAEIMTIGRCRSCKRMFAYNRDLASEYAGWLFCKRCADEANALGKYFGGELIHYEPETYPKERPEKTT